MASVVCSDFVTIGGCSAEIHETNLDKLKDDLAQHVRSNHPNWLSQQSPQILQAIPFILQRIVRNAYSII